MKKHYRTIWISDLHLGTNDAQIDVLLDFLENTKCDSLYLLGDIVDFWQLCKNQGWSQKCNNLLRRILSKIRKGTRVYITFGNHDTLLSLLSGFHLGEISFSEEFIHRSLDGKTYLCHHGDRYDSFLVAHSKIGFILTLFYHWFRWVPGSFPFKGWLERRLGDQNCRERAEKERERRGFDGIICGHTHLPKISEDRTYLNCGDWTHHCTALVEEEDGNLDLISWALDEESTDRLIPMDPIDGFSK